MPPWPDWQFEYIGSQFLGRLLGLWSALWVSLLKRLFRFLTKTIVWRASSASYSSNESPLSGDTQPLESGPSAAKKLYKITASTLLTLGVWRLATLKAVWSAV